MQNQPLNLQYNEKMTLTGVYTKSVLSKKPTAEHKGHFKIVVNDTLEVVLLPPYHSEALRPRDEVKKMEGKKVTVIGILLPSTSISKPTLEEQPLTINVPCFATIDSIKLADNG